VFGGVRYLGHELSDAVALLSTWTQFEGMAAQNKFTSFPCLLFFHAFKLFFAFYCHYLEVIGHRTTFADDTHPTFLF
jgi:hypothetical protein